MIFQMKILRKMKKKKIKLSIIDFNPKKIMKFSKIRKTSEDNIIEVQMIKYHPQNLINCIKFFCPKSEKISSLENDFKTNINSKFNCTNCKSDFIQSFYYKMIFE